MSFLPRSITGRLFLWLFFGAAAILICASVLLFSEVRELVIGSVDRTLHSKRQMITGLLHEEHGRVELELSDIIAGEYVIPRSGHYYSVLADNAPLAVSPSLAEADFVFHPSGAATPVNGQPNERVYTSTGPDDEPVRVLRYRYAAFDKVFDITLAESLVDGLGMISAFRSFLLISIPLTLLLLSFAAWRIAKAALRPLAAFSTTIEMITHKNLAERIDAGSAAQELARLAQSFNAMLDRLSTVFEGQKRLIADASHELKTPLSVIRTECDVALQRERTAKEYAEILKTIQSSSHGMTKLVNDLLSLARLDSGLVFSQNFAQVTIKDCILEAVRNAGPLAAEKRVTVTTSIEEELFVTGSRVALSEAFLNLIENAVRYNKEKGSVAISAVKDAGKTVITISDTGIGMKKSDLERIFERFFRADTARSSDGTGLGLSIVQSVVKAHGGTITVESEPGKGSRFTIVLPLFVASE